MSNRTTLHLFRSAPDEWVNLLADALVGNAPSTAMRLYDEPVDYAHVIEAVFSHDRVICWW